MPTPPTQSQPVAAFRPSETIEEVVERLDAIIDDCHRRRSRMGYFPALYRRVTVEVKGRMDKGRFRDAERMEALDVIFANRYLEAYEQYRRGERPTRSWAYAFERAEDDALIVLQHLLLGMNAHINLDLGIAAARVADRYPKEGFRDDFDQINTILANLVDDIQDRLGVSSLLLRVADWMGGRLDERMCGYGLAKARTTAWQKAQTLGNADPADWPAYIERYDRAVRRLAGGICLSRPGLASLIAHIRETEHPDVRVMLDRMR